MLTFVQATVNGIQGGSPYALIALSIVLIFTTMRAFNFAQASMAAVSGILAYVCIGLVGLPWALGFVLALGLTAVFGAAIEWGIVRPLQRAEVLILVVATLGLDTLLNASTQLIMGPNPLKLPGPVASGEVSLGELHASSTYLFMIATTLVIVMALGYLLQRTNLGLGLRAYAQNPTAAALMGVPVRTVSRVTWILAAVLGGVAGVLLGSVLFVKIGYMSGPFIQSFAAAILGGLTSWRGAVIGGFLLGILESLSVTYLPEAVTTMVPLLVILAMLLLRPAGLFGRAGVERA